MFAPPAAKPKSTKAEPQRSRVAPQRPSPPAINHMLQWNIGNEARHRLLVQPGPGSLARRDPQQEAAGPGAQKAAPGFVFDFSKISVVSPGEKPPQTPLDFPAPRLPIQAKLKVGAVDDPLEHEADRVADQVMRMPAPEVSLVAAPPKVSRKCAACEEEEKKLQKKEAGTAEFAAVEAPASVYEVLRSPGQPLDPEARSYFEPRFGHGFGHVRVHTDRRAANSARAVNALAFTVGNNIVFAEGRYDPRNVTGRRLIAHELVHNLQQGGRESPAKVDPAPSSSGLGISHGQSVSIQRVGECAGKKKGSCFGNCVPASGKGTGFCRWSGTIKYGCICIAADQPMLQEALQRVLLAALITIGVFITLAALAALIACFLSGACEVAALAAVLGLAGALLVIGFLRDHTSGAGAGGTAAAGNTEGTGDATAKDAGSGESVPV